MTFCNTVVLVLDALRAHDTYTARCKGAQTRKTDLNLPEEWAFPSPLGICSPVHLCGDDHSRNQRKRRHKIERKDTLLHSRTSIQPTLLSPVDSNYMLAIRPKSSLIEEEATETVPSPSLVQAINEPTSPDMLTSDHTSLKASGDRINLETTEIIDLVDEPVNSACIADSLAGHKARNHPKLMARDSKYPALPAEGFPSNWTIRLIPRKSGELCEKGPLVDKYWYSPKMKYLFRSKKQVNSYLECLKESNGDEVNAMLHFSGSKKAYQSVSHDSPSTSAIMKSSPPREGSQFKVIEFIEPPGSSTNKKRVKGVEHESRKKGDCNPGVPTITTGYLKPCIKKGEKVYACWGVRNGLGQEWFPGRVWDVKEYAIGDYGPQYKYDVVYDDGDTESNVQEIWVMKKNEYEMGIKNPEENWIGVTNITFPESKDNYAKLIGWYKLTCGGDHPVYSSLGDALRAHDKVIFRVCFDASQMCIRFSYLL